MSPAYQKNLLKNFTSCSASVVHLQLFAENYAPPPNKNTPGGARAPSAPPGYVYGGRRRPEINSWLQP